MRSPTIRPNLWFAFMRSRFPCTPMSGRRRQLLPARWPDVTTNTNDAERRTCFAPWSPRPASIPTLGVLKRESRAWNRQMNRDRVKINWQFTRKKAREKFGY